MTIALLWACAFLTVFLLGFQSRSVNRGQYVASASCSAMIAMTQCTWVRWVASHDWLMTVIVTGTAGPSAICAAIFVHQRLHKPKP